MAYIVMAYIVMAPYSYGLHSYGVLCADEDIVDQAKARARVLGHVRALVHGPQGVRGAGVVARWPDQAERVPEPPQMHLPHRAITA